ncbi:hypothetical protein WMO12_00005, partial [Bifidobacterium mongoliense]
LQDALLTDNNPSLPQLPVDPPIPVASLIGGENVSDKPLQRFTFESAGSTYAGAGTRRIPTARP